MGLFDFFSPRTLRAGTIDSSGGLRIDQLVTPPATPGNVAICLSGGGSRAMTAGMGQLRALKHLQLNGKSLLSQTRVLSTVSGGSWVGQTFSYLRGVTTDDALLNRYVADPGRLVPSSSPEHSQSETLNELPAGNLGRCIGTRMFSPAGLAVCAYLLWKFFRVPSEMLWQTLIGSNILEPYGLYTPSRDQAPDSLFSFDPAILKRDVLDLNPGLSEEQEAMHLVASGAGRDRRPFPICNMAMFVEMDGDGFNFLAPVQSTPFITGVLGMPEGRDANGRRPGGGGVTSFGFSSEPRGIDQQLVKFKQDRRWALTDSIGTSSAFFAEALQNLFQEWSLDVDRFFAGVDEVAEELEGWLRKLLWDLGLLGRDLSPLVDGIAAGTRGAPAGRRARIERVFAAMGDSRKELAAGFRELSLQRLIPNYGYWPVSDPSPVNDFKTTRFADGGNLDNTGIGGLLVYEDVDNLIAFINTSTPLTAGDRGVLDAQGNELPGTRIVVDGQIPPLFGYQPWQEGKGYRLYAGDGTPESPEMRHNQVFPSASFAELLQVLWQNSDNAADPGSNRHAALCRQQLEVQSNRWFGIPGGKSLGVIWVYNNRVRDWYDALRPEVQAILGDFNDPASYKSFPHFRTSNTQLDPTEVNLLSSLSAWVVAADQNADLFRGMYQKDKGEEI
jgi:hypothetical protein